MENEHARESCDTQMDTVELGWWLVSGEDLLGVLRRVASGEDPDLVFAECYANAGDAASLLGDDEGGRRAA
jgi:hypothetical protein